MTVGITFIYFQAFTITFSDCKPESKLKLACISTVRDMIIPVSNFFMIYTVQILADCFNPILTFYSH